jgi:1-aminocyclopropane-1-carboxylate deaminase/D-cysteine desulfhydrase-like pyridoxal-dependent ACC family enzyme
MPMTLALFSDYPEISAHLPHVCLGGFPTPIEKLGALGVRSDTQDLFIKRDDLSGDVHGGNKVRKLETLLGDARQSGARGILTFGYLESGHALATAIYARKLGLPVTCILLSETTNERVREHLLLSHYYGATLVLSEADDFIQRRDSIIAEQVGTFEKLHGAPPYVIPFGGTSTIGTAAYVNAAFELKQQISDGLMPELDYIYVALATMGTAAGLALGLKVARLKTKVVAVRVVSPKHATEEKLLDHLGETNRFLHALDDSFPLLDPVAANIEIRHEFYGESYGVPTSDAMTAVDLLAAEGIRLESTYTGKTFAALLHDLRIGRLRNKTALFWHTANSKDNSSLVSGLDYHALPREFHQYF